MSILSKQWKHEYRTLFCIGSLIGILCFICVYGVRILDFTYTGWLMNGDMDLKQHFLGWCHYRASDWHVPIGLIDTLSYPTSVSVIWTDSIPLFAVIFKLLRGILPETFQYFGLFGLLCFVLQGGISILLVRKFTEDKAVCILSVPFFILSFTLLQRMYYHTALGAQWLLLLALLIWLYEERVQTTVKKCAAWAGMGFLCVSIHSYFVPMVGLLMLGSLVDAWLGKCEGGQSRLGGLSRNQKVSAFFKEVGLPTVAYCVAAFLNLLLLGAFYQNASPVGEGIGAFCSNLNTFINSLGNSAILQGLPLYGEFQYEGFGYLGAGILLLLIVITVRTVRVMTARKMVVNRAFFRRHRRVTLLGLTALIFCVLAVFPMVTLGDLKLFGVPYPGFIKTIMNIFRSNGRFIWTPMYILMLGAVVMTARADRYFPKSDQKKDRMGIQILITVAVLIQILDVSKMVGEKQEYFAKTEHSYQPVWDMADGELAEQLVDVKHFIFMYDENDWIMDTAYYAYYHGMTQNNYYYARSYCEQINAQIEAYQQELEQGMVREDAVYIFRQQDLEEHTYEGLQLEILGDHVVGTPLK